MVLMSKKILIVDDEKALAKALEIKLSHEGFETSVAYDGSEAIDALAKDHYDLVLLDLVMPNLDGFAVLEKINASNIKTTVIVSSNLSQEEDAEKAKSLGAAGYFVKSDMSLSDIVKKVKINLEN